MNRRCWRDRFGRGGVIGVCLGGLVVMLAGGCYSRVISARGPGAEQYNVSEPYQQDSRLDRWFYGDRSDRRNRSLLDDRSSR